MFGSLKIDGKKVKDAKKELIITITATDVKGGAKKNSNSCAAARALMRQTGCTRAKVHATRTYIEKDGEWQRFLTPEALRKEIVAFDRGGTFEPGDYRLVPLSPSQRQGKRNERNSNATKKRNGPKRAPHMTTGVRRRMEKQGQIF